MGDGGTRERRSMLVTLAVDIGSTATKVHTLCIHVVFEVVNFDLSVRVCMHVCVCMLMCVNEYVSKHL